MTHLRSKSAVALFALLGACVEYDMSDRVTDIGYTGPYGIEEVQRTCTPGDADTWWFGVETEGWADRVDVLVVAPATPDVVETHPLGNVDYDPAGTWDSWEVTLLTATEVSDAQPGATTAWGCDDAPSLAWQAVMYAPEEPEVPVDCAVWGPQASQALALSGPADLDCTCVEEDGDCTN